MIATIFIYTALMAVITVSTVIFLGGILVSAFFGCKAICFSS